MAEVLTLTTNDLAADFSNLESQGAFHGPDWLAEARNTAVENFKRVGMPTADQEDWRFTSVAALGKIHFEPASGDALPDIVACDYETLASFSRIRAVFVNGFFSAEQSELSGLPKGVFIGSLKDAISGASELGTASAAWAEHLTQITIDADHPFMNSNTAMFQDGAFIHAEAEAVCEEPIHLIFLSAAGERPTVSYPRNLIVAEKHSQITVMETYAGAAGDVYFTNSVTEVSVGQNAIVDHYKYQQESKSAFHFSTLEIRQERASNFSTQAVTFGGGLVRNDVGFTLHGEGCLSTMNGLYQIGGRQHVDNHTRIDHAFPNCESHEYYKGLLDDQARGVFNGKIMVRQIAQKTNAKQTNRNLLLSTGALINTNPQLEIFADDVKCTHGATIGQLDEKQVFYLRSRGLDETSARRILAYAFANEIIERIKVEPLRAELERLVAASQFVPSEILA